MPELPDKAATDRPEGSGESPEDSRAGEPDETLAFERTSPPPTTPPTDSNLKGPPEEAPSTPTAPPRQFDEYQIVAEIGRGGMGVVYRAVQVTLNRTVAIKMIRSGSLASEHDVRRFYAEAQAAGRLRHDGIVAIYEMGEHEGHHWFAMDYVEGRSLADLSEEGVSQRQAAEYVRGVAEAIEHAHQNGILHRDLKPANVLIGLDDRPVVTDFGLAKLLGDDQGMTATGVALGTPSYMPPEQASGRIERMGPASDVYSLGAILYELITGQPPFKGENQVETVMDVLHKEPPPAEEIVPTVDPALATICSKCLRKEPESRYASAGELAEDLGRWLAGEPIRAKPVGRLTKTWHWFRDIPLVAAILHRESRGATRAHRLAQWGMIALPFLLAGLVALWQERLPMRIRIAAGDEGGLYHRFGERLQSRLASVAPKRRLSTLTTAGSLNNQRLLAERASELALVQADVIDPSASAVVAPLYLEVVHILVRSEGDIREPAQLQGRSVALGPPESGMRITAEAVLRTLDVSPGELRDTEADLTRLANGAELDAGVVTIGLKNDRIPRLLAEGRFALLPLPRRDVDRLARDSGLVPYTILPEDYPQASLPEEGISTVASAALLATHPEASDALVETTLRALYMDDELISAGLLTPRDRAGHWRGMAWHPAAYAFFFSP